MNYLNTINTIDTPHNFARRIHLKTKKNIVEVPGYGELTICEHGYINTSGVDHAFGAGTLIDLCALKYRCSTAGTVQEAYARALAEIVAEYDDRLHLPPSIKQVLRTAINTRKLLDFFRKKALKDRNVKNGRKTTFKFTASDRKIFTSLLSAILDKDITIGNEQVKVWYGWSGLITTIEVTKNNRVLKQYNLDTTFGVSYTNLALYDPDKTIFLNTKPTHINAHNYFFDTTEYPFQAVEVRAHKKAKQMWLPPRVVIEPPAMDATALFSIAPLIAAGVYVCSFDGLATLDKDEHYTLHDYVKNSMLHIIVSENAIPLTIQDILTSSALPRSLCNELKEALQGRVDLATLSQFRHLIPSSALYARGDKVYYESYRGYDVAVEDEKFRITNYTLDFTHYLAFPKQEGLHLSGRVVMENRVFDVTIPSDVLNTPNQLDKAVKHADILSGTKGSVPSIYSPVEFKIICNRLRTKVEDLPVLEGLMSLGWDFVSRTFASPTFVADEHGLRYRAAVPHPNKLRLTGFDYKQPSKPPAESALKNVSISAWKVACICMAQSAIGASGMPLAGVAIKNTPEATALLKTLFKALGQTAPIYLGQNNRHTDNDEFYGYPFYGFSGSAEIVSASKFPILGLAETGLELTGKAGNKNLLRTTLVKCLPTLAGTPTHTRSAGVTHTERLIKEGAVLLKAAGFTVPKAVCDTEYPRLAEFLGDTLPVYNYDMHTNTATVAWPSEVLDELKWMSGLAVDGVDKNLTITGTLLFSILNNWFGIS